MKTMYKYRDEGGFRRIHIYAPGDAFEFAVEDLLPSEFSREDLSLIDTGGFLPSENTERWLLQVTERFLQGEKTTLIVVAETREELAAFVRERYLPQMLTTFEELCTGASDSFST